MVYAGIGSRETPEDVLNYIESYAYAAASPTHPTLIGLAVGLITFAILTAIVATTHYAEGS